MNNGTVNKKRLVIRLVLLALLVALGFLLYYYGKEHEVLLDNKTVNIGGQTYAAAEFVRITVNGDTDKQIELYAKERDMVKVTGPRHTIKVEIVDEDSDEVLRTEERVLDLGKASSVMISVPAVAEKAPDVYLPLPGTMTQAPEPETSTEAATEEIPEAGMEEPPISE